MTLKQQIDQDLKAAMLGGDSAQTSVLRGLKSAILYEEVAKGVREQGLTDNEVITVLQKEAKKRQESADLYNQGNSPERAEQELSEKSLIEKYLPAQLSTEELNQLIEQSVSELNAHGLGDMGKVIALVKEKSAGRADGATIAGLVKARLSQ